MATLRDSIHIGMFKQAIRMSAAGPLPDNSNKPYANLGPLAVSDAMAVAFVAMMEATSSVQNDLKNVIEGMKRTNLAAAQEHQVLRIIGDVTQSIRTSRWRTR